MTKKIFAISTLLFVLVVGAIFVYNYAFKLPNTQKEKVSDQKTESEGKAETASQEETESKKEGSAIASVTAISSEPVFGATLSADGKYIYYFSKASGQLNQVNLDGKLEKVLSTEKFEKIKRVLWNKSRNKVIIKQETAPGKMKYLFFDISAGKISPLKENIDTVTWSNLGDKIVYKYFDLKSKKRSISVADPDGSNWRDIADFDYQGVEISPVFGSSSVSFWPSPNAFLSTSVNITSWNGEGQKTILKDRFGVDVLWSPSGTQAAVSASDQKGGHTTQLYLANGSGGEIQSLMFPTFVSKCAWSADSKFLFCAMPGNIPESAILPNDWQEGKVTSIDTFWKIEVASGKKERLVDPQQIDGSYDILNPFLSQDEKSLFFISKSDGKLYRLTI